MVLALSAQPGDHSVRFPDEGHSRVRCGQVRLCSAWGRFWVRRTRHALQGGGAQHPRRWRQWGAQRPTWPSICPRAHLQTRRAFARNPKILEIPKARFLFRKDRLPAGLLVPCLCRACAVLLPCLCRACAVLVPVPYLCRACAVSLPCLCRACGGAVPAWSVVSSTYSLPWAVGLGQVLCGGPRALCLLRGKGDLWARVPLSAARGAPFG